LGQRGHARVALEQAHAVWQWWSYYATQVPDGKRPLRINMDETAVCVFQGGGGKGNVFIHKTVRAVLNVARGPRRTYLTHLAFVCDDAAVQPILPQILIANERTVPAGQLAALRAACPPNVFLLRRRSAWVDGALIATIIRSLGLILAPHMTTLQPILFFDACKAHLTNCVFAACAAVNVWPIVVPARMTWLLQPLDTHAFLLFKIRLQQSCHAARVRAADGGLSLTELLVAIIDAIHTVLEARGWGDAFDRDGYGVGQAGLSDRVLRELGAAAAPTIPATRPTLLRLQACFPRNRRVREELIWRAVSQPAGGGSAAGAPAGVLALPRAAAAPRRSLRTQALNARLGLPTGSSSSAASSSSAGPPMSVPAVSKAPPPVPAAGGAGASSSTAAAPNTIMTRSKTRSLRLT